MYVSSAATAPLRLCRRAERQNAWRRLQRYQPTRTKYDLSNKNWAAAQETAEIIIIYMRNSCHNFW